MSTPRPDIFNYRDYRQFLVDWFKFKKLNHSTFSMRALAKQVGLASGYIPMVVAGKRALSQAAWQKISPALGFTPSEKSFFENLLSLDSTNTHAVRIAALERMKRSSRYQKQNPKDTEVYEYLTHWYYVAIREMASIEGFQADPRWIQARLLYPATLQEVSTALEFLLAHGYLVKGPEGVIQPPQKSLDCSGDIYKVALGQYHRELLKLAAQSIETTPSDEREVVGHTVALSPKSMTEAREIVKQAIQKIRDLGENEPIGESVYHMEVALFPLTQNKGSHK